MWNVTYFFQDLIVTIFIVPYTLLYSSQVSASLDALTDIAGGKVNIHVLMAFAAFASIFMGNSLEGGLLLAMFNLAHIGKLFKLGDCQIFQG